MLADLSYLVAMTEVIAQEKGAYSYRE